MAEIGVVRFARVAREVAEAALPRYRSPFSKHTFAQPTLLAILCLMRYEDWIYREAEVRISLLGDQAQALGARPWALVSHATDAGPSARHRLQPLPPPCPFALPSRLPLIMRMSTRPAYL